MKIKEGFELQNVCGEFIIVPTGIENVDYSKIISLNESAVLLWREVEGKEFTSEILAALLMKHYDVDEFTALADSNRLIEQWVSVGVVSE